MRDEMLDGGRSVPVQDTDLLGRLNAYFDDLEGRLQQGQGWLIFNSSRGRGARILRLMLQRLDPYRPFISLHHMTWRDFAIHAYVSTIALPRDAALREGASAPESGLVLGSREREFAIASNVTNAAAFQLTHADLLILSNIAPAQLHEAIVLSQTAVDRAAHRRAVIALTEHDPWSLAEAFNAADQTGTTWRHFHDAMHQTSLIAH